MWPTCGIQRLCFFQKCDPQALALEYGKGFTVRESSQQKATDLQAFPSSFTPGAHLHNQKEPPRMWHVSSK